MALNLHRPILYLITSGETTLATNSASAEFARLLSLVRAAVASGINLIQLREKNLSARTLYELASRAADLTRGSAARLLVNDRADIARAAGCDGVHLTARSLSTRVVRKTFGQDFLIGVSTHSLAEALHARDHKADFALFGPVFDTPSKRPYGPPLGLRALGQAARALSDFPLIAIGGITLDNALEVLATGAHGVAAIRLFSDPHTLETVARKIK